MKLYDPLSYQFAFRAITDGKDDVVLNPICEAFLQELLPYIKEWENETTEKNPMFCIEPRSGDYLDVQFCDSFDDYINQMMQEEGKGPFNKFIFTQYGRGMPDKYCVHLNAKEGKARKKYFDTREIMDIEERKARTAEIMLYPQERMQGICYPLSYFTRRALSINMSISPIPRSGDLPPWKIYRNWNYGQFPYGYRDKRRRIVSVKVDFPRMLLCGKEFPFQSAWVERLKTLGNQFPVSLGMVELDVTEGSKISNFSVGYMKKAPFDPNLPDYAWTMMFPKYQVEGVGGLPFFTRKNLFYNVEELNDGNVFIQMTENIDEVPTELIKQTADAFSEHMIKQEHCFAGAFMPSYRCYVRKEDIIGFGFHGTSVMLP